MGASRVVPPGSRVVDSGLIPAGDHGV